VSDKDQTLPYGHKRAAEEAKRASAPAKTALQAHSLVEPARAASGHEPAFVSASSVGDTTLVPVGSGSFAEAEAAANCTDEREAAASGTWRAPVPDLSAPRPKQRDQSPAPVASARGIILTVGWIEQILDLSLGRQIDIQVAGLGRNFEIQLNEKAIVDVLGSLASYVRENMPNGGTLTLQAAHVDLKDPAFATKLGLPLDRYVFLGLSHISTSRAAGPDVFREPSHVRAGLGTVLSLVKNHGGSVTVNEEKDRVHGFSIYLPAADSKR